MAFTNIPDSDIDPGSPITTDLMTQLRDNDEFLFTQTGGLVLIEKKVVTSDTQDLTFSGLDGNTDAVYRMVGRIVVSGAAEDVTLRPNGISTNQDSIIISQSGSAVSRGTSTDLKLVDTFSSGGTLQTFDAIFWAKNDPNSIAVNRTLQSEFGLYTATLPERVGQIRGLWDEDSTNVTSLVVHGQAADTIRDGSTVALYKLRQS